MCAAIARSEPVLSAAPVRRWADGAAEIGFAARDGHTALRHLYQSDPCRVLFPCPPPGAPPEAVIVTTSGGLVGGDRLRIHLSAGDGAMATVTSQAAEKVYRSAGADCEIDIDIEVAAGGLLEWMPQETILFEGARLMRRARISLAPNARTLAGEIVIFGRLARGERFSRGFLHDCWRLRIDGRLAWADALHLDGDIGARLAGRYAFDGAVAAGMLIYAGPDAGDRLGAVRDLLDEHVRGCTAGATCLDRVLLVRFLGPDATALRRSYVEFWAAFRSGMARLPHRVPRVWET